MFVTLGVLGSCCDGNFMILTLPIPCISARAPHAIIGQSAWLLQRIKRFWFTVCRSCWQDLFMYLKNSATPFNVIAEFPEVFFNEKCVLHFCNCLTLRQLYWRLSSKGKPMLHSHCFHSWLGTEQQSCSKLDLFLLTFSYDTPIRNLMSCAKMRHEALERMSLMLCESKSHALC